MTNSMPGGRATFGQRNAPRQPAPQQTPAASAPTTSSSGGGKRTAVLTLTILGVGAVGYGVFSSLDSGSEAPAAPSFATVDACVAGGTLSRAECEAGWTHARQTHDDTAPAFASVDDCEKAAGPGQCAQASTSGDPQRRSMFIPILTGYYMGRLASGGVGAAPAPVAPRVMSTAQGMGARMPAGAVARGGFGGASAGHAASS